MKEIPLLAYSYGHCQISRLDNVSDDLAGLAGRSSWWQGSKVDCDCEA